MSVSAEPLLLGLLAILLGSAFFIGPSLPDRIGGEVDYVGYASAARVLLAGGNPYDPSALAPLQRAAGWQGGSATAKVQMMWNPPWVAPLILPTAWLGWTTGFLIWNTVQLLAVIYSVVLLGRIYGGPAFPLAGLLAISVVFAPTIFLLRLGQISGLMVLGLTGFLAARRAGRPFLAGAALTLLAIKPHLFLPMTILLLFDSFVHRSTRNGIVFGSSMLLIASLIPLIWNSHVWTDYLDAVQAPGSALHYAPSDWRPPILAGWLARAFDGGVILQFAPSVLASCGLIVFWWTRRRKWDWERELPLVVAVSIVTTGYGAWAFDLVVLLLVVIPVAVTIVHADRPRLRLWATAGFLGLNSLILAGLEPRLGIYPVLFWSPAVVVLYFAVRATLMPPSTDTNPAPVCR